ncbi:type IX secretion system outer membrane channel protein PorV [Zunongwangia sp. HRR-M8]|uniref:type IX secretion system outer membrane channel protein PorV n=1 Tax=Zunongwangia sp. HRR-M8 TaxID=3015170 RepID=UPI0022DE5C0D|nr:type IX secretion system outer membrane channel protein PorV [Zunongwangia sp. HRR-M8]WBL21909.1 type IX secretion system outer membrane channel protein PorV [Zunongwangia sp. HRR-M8]
MKKLSTILLLGLVFTSNHFRAQELRDRVITTAVPFLLVAADARAAGMGDQGVATPVDVFSQQWNPAKFAFATSENGIGMSYTPYLKDIVSDIFLGDLSYYRKIDDRSAFAASFRFFSLGTIETRQTIDQFPLPVNPNELTFDASYALKLSETFSMAVAGRYLRSDLGLSDGQDLGAAGSFGVDVAAYYQSEEVVFQNFDGIWRLGVNISNIGPKMKYDDAGQENFIPTNLRLGGGFDFIFNPDSKLGVYLEFNKLLVPTPQDFNGDGVIDREDDDTYNNVSAISGIFKSFSDAPNGFSEEMKEVTWALGTEYSFRDAIKLRAGYFNESDEKGYRKFVSFGGGFTYDDFVIIDVSYLFSTSDFPSPLDKTLRFGLTFNFGDEYIN